MGGLLYKVQSNVKEISSQDSQLAQNMTAAAQISVGVLHGFFAVLNIHYVRSDWSSTLTAAANCPQINEKNGGGGGSRNIPIH